MCGISGYLLEDIPPNIDKLDESLSHRGPDDKGFYKEKIDGAYFGLYHRRLSIYDLSNSSSQPIKSNCGNYIISFNGAIYNYKKIWGELTNSKIEETNSDTKALIEAISTWGTLKTWEKINGMFAIAVVDKNSSCLKLVRDRVGQKPLFYVIDPIINERIYRGIIFASEIKALSCLIKVSLDENYLTNYLRLGKLDSFTNTIYKEIKRLDPAYELTYKIDSGIISYKKFWELENKVISLIRNNSKKDLEYMTKTKINNSISLQITGDRKLGIMLSSGIDSTVLACLMRERYENEIYSFTYDFDNCEEGESEIAKVVSDKIGLKVIPSRPLSPSFIKENLTKVILQQDEPITSIRTVAQHYIHSLADKENCKILIEGNGGDEIFGGYDHYKYARLLDAILDERMETSTIIESFKDSKNENLITGLRSILMPGICSKDATEVRKLSALNDYFLNYDYKIQNYKILTKSFLDNLNQTVGAQLHDLICIFLPRSLRYVDRASMAYGNEARAPLLDNNVIEYGLAYSHKTGLNEYRDLLRSMANKNIIDIVGKKKRTIVDPQRDWLYIDLFDWCLDILHESKEILKSFYKFDILIKNIHDERDSWIKDKKGNSGPFMQALNLAILLNKSL
tara:strand:+ start:545 stop:2419 length:1875 start_codon:yes stop_codon:yes gene_type:complete